MNFIDTASIPTLDTTGLIIAYVVIGAALLGLNLFSSWNWFIKTAMNIIVVGFFWVTYHSWPGILGWPTERDVPGQFYLHAVNIDEPHRIYLWGTDLERGLGQTVPRSYSIPYNRKLHDRVDKVTRKLRKGLPVIGQVSNKAGAQQEMTTLEQTQTADVDIVFIDAPQGLIPGKN